jgi:hypothetical protein
MNRSMAGVLTLLLASASAFALVVSSQKGGARIQIVKTPRQKEHGKLFRHGGQSLLELAAERGGDVVVFADEPLGFGPDVGETRPFAESAACNAEVIVIGSLTGETAQFNEGETFIFTDYELAVEEVIKGVDAVRPGSKLTVTRDGGALTAGGRRFKAIREDFELFPLGGRYLFFLKSVPATGSYLAYQYGSFQLDGNKVRAFAEVPHVRSMDATALLAETRAAALSGCEN